MAYLPIAFVLLGVAAASPFPQGVTAAIPPTAPAPPGCVASYSGSFGIAVAKITAAAAGGVAPR